MDIATLDAFGKSSGVYAFMNTAWAWPFMESLHYMGLALLLGTVGLFDLRALGFFRSIDIHALHRFAPLGLVAFAINVSTGVLFFLSAPDQYAFNPSFQLKVASMMIAGVNAGVFYTTAARNWRGSADETVPFVVKIIAAVSLLSWFAVIIFGRLITYFRPPYHWCFWC